MPGLMHLRRNGHSEEFELTPIINQSLGRSRITFGISSLGKELEENHCSTSFHALSYMGSPQISYRHIVIISAEYYESVCTRLRDNKMPDRNWVVFDGSDEDLKLKVFFLTFEQAKYISTVPFHHRAYMENGQELILKPISTSDKFGDWYMLQTFPSSPSYFSLSENESANIRQFYPYNRLGSNKSQAPMSLLLNPEERKSFPRFSYANICPLDDKWKAQKHLFYPLSVQYHPNVPLGRVCLHETLLLALGYGPGDPLAIFPTDFRLPWKERPFFLQRRRMVALVQPATDFDAGFPVARLADAAIDILGIVPGQKISIMGRGTPLANKSEKLSSKSRSSRFSSTKVRCLSKRDGSNPGTVTAEYFPADTFIPGIELDLVRREQLAVKIGEPVIIRPAYQSILIDEITLLTNTVVIGFAASVFTMNFLYISLTMALLLILLSIRFHRKFES